MPIFVMNTANSTEFNVENFIEFIHKSLPFDFISANRVKTKSDLEQNVFMGKVRTRSIGRHAKKGQYYKLILTELSNSKRKRFPNPHKLKVVVYVYHACIEEIKINDGDFVAVSKADVVFSNHHYNIPHQHAYDISCEDISTDETDLSKPFVWVMLSYYPSPRSSFEDEVKFPSITNSPHSALTTLKTLSKLNYKCLRDIEDGDECFIFAVVMDKKPITKTKGSSYVCVMYIRDDTLDKNQENFNLNVFFHKIQDLPTVKLGYIIRCKLKAEMFNRQISGKVYEQNRCRFWPSTSDDDDSSLLVEEQAIVKQLRNWVGNEYPQYLIIHDDKPPVSLNLVPLQMISDKDERFDIICRVLEVIKRIDSSTDLIVDDKFRSHDDEDGDEESPVPLSKLVKISVIGKQRIYANSLKFGDVICLRNVRRVRDPTNKNPDKIMLVLLDREDYPRFLVKCNPVQENYLRKNLQRIIDKRGSNSLKNINYGPSPKRSKLDVYDCGWICTPTITNNNPIFYPSNSIDSDDESFELSVEMPVESGMTAEINADIIPAKTQSFDEDSESDVELTKSPPKRVGKWYCVVKDIRGNKSTVALSGDQIFVQSPQRISDEEIVIEGVYDFRDKIKNVEIVDLSDESDVSENNSRGIKYKVCNDVVQGNGNGNGNGFQRVTRTTILSNQARETPTLPLTITPRGNLPFTKLTCTPSINLPLFTLNELETLRPESKARIRVKSLGVFPPLTDDDSTSFFISRCPACEHVEPYTNFSTYFRDVHCPVCPTAYMQRIFSIQIEVFDRTGNVKLKLTGAEAVNFFGVTPIDYFSKKRNRTIVRNIIHLIYFDTENTNLLESNNSWLDLIVLNTETNSVREFNITDTVCELKN